MAEGGEDAELSEDLLAGSEWGCDFPCHPCSVEGDVLESSGFCVTCDEYLCDECFRHHRKTTALRHHVLLDSDSMPKDTSERKSVDVCTDPCKAHSAKVVEYYCLEHHSFGCSVCMTMNHKNCDIQYIPDVANDVVKSGELKRLQENADTIIVKVRDHFETHAEKSKTCAAEAVKAFNDMKKKFIDKLKLAEKQLMKDIDAISAADSDKIASASEQFESEIKETQSMMKQCEQLSKNQQMCKLFVLTKAVKKRIEMLGDDFEKTEKDVVNTKYTLVPNKQVRKVLINPQLMSKRTGYTDARKDRDISVKSGADNKLCWITGLELLSHNIAVAVDRSNCLLKMLDIDQNEVIAACQMPSAPRDIAKLPDNRVVVACSEHESSEIVFVDTGDNSLKVSKKINVNGKCCGMSHANDRLIISFPDKDRIDIITMNGDTEKSFYFEYPFNIYADCSQKSIFVTTPGDRATASVTHLSMDGTKRAIYTDTKCKGPIGFCVDSYGISYVCCWTSNNIHMLSDSFRKEKIILTSNDGLYQPYAICINDANDELLVGMRDNNTIFVYHLS